MNDPEALTTAKTILTPAQHEAWILHTTTNHGTRHIALHLGISRAAVIDRLDAAARKLRQHGITQDINGHWHKEPNT
jgi:biotin operon repressor